ncbi:MAG TPA: hypothetical protein VFT64_08855 [Rickettsiales bacterium]|nr:hypothetical protein [Rickettsiales bacterium]
MANYHTPSQHDEDYHAKALAWFEKFDSDMREAILIRAVGYYDNFSVEDAVGMVMHEMTESGLDPKGYSGSYKGNAGKYINNTGAFRETVLAIAEKMRDADCNGKPYELPPIVYWKRVTSSGIDYERVQHWGIRFNPEKLDALCEQYGVEKYSVKHAREAAAEAGSGAGRGGRS